MTLPGFCSLKHSCWDKVRADHCCVYSIFALHAKFHAQRFIKSDSSKLTGTIVGQSVHPDQPSRASDVDDMAMVSFDHSWEECFTSLCGERKKKFIFNIIKWPISQEYNLFIYGKCLHIPPSTIISSKWYHTYNQRLCHIV